MKTLNFLLKILNQSSTWNTIYKNLLNYNYSQDNSAGKIFEEFCKYYYLVEPTVKHDYKNVWLFSEIPHTIKEKLNLGRVDHGIDLVLEGQDNSLSVVQCKFRNNQGSNISWTKDSLANLFADGDKADYFIVFTNASGLDRYSLKKKANQLKLVTLGDLLNISPSTLNEIKNSIAGLTIKPAVKTPREYQQKAIQDVISGFQKNDRGQLILPCGAGKTLVSLWIKEKIQSKHTLVLVPSLALLRQIKNEWAINSNRFIPYICVCSEKDVNKEKDNAVVHTYEIGGKVSTNPSEILDFLNNHNETIVYSTYQSLEAICKAIKNTSFSFDIAICDEAHKTSGSKLSNFGLIHLDTNILAKKRLYMTATPRVLSDSLKSELNDEVIDCIHDMSNAFIFGPVLHRMSFKQAIDKKILVDYQIIAIGINDKEIKEAIKKRKYTSDNETIDELANNFALEKFMKKHEATHAITFHSSVKKAKAFQMRHRKIYPGVSTYHVNGELKTNERNVLIKEFEHSPKSVMTNARCLTEGVDVPAIDAIYFCDPKNSKIDIVQATGRALRRSKHKNKKLGYVLVPIFHHKKEGLEEEIKESIFKNLINVITALSAHDEILNAEIQKIIYGENKRKSTENKIIEFISDSIILEGITGKLKDMLVDEIFFQLIGKREMLWEEQYLKLSQYYNGHSHCNLPDKYPDQQLKTWVSNQRSKYSNKKLSEERTKKLLLINFIFHPHDKAWEIGFSKLCEHVKQYGHCDVPHNLTKYASLISWIAAQRSNYASLTKIQKQRLEAIGFKHDPRNERWESKFNLLNQFYNDHGHCNVPDSDEYKQLSKWIGHQRTAYKKNKLSGVQLNKLKNLNFSFALFDQDWERNFGFLTKFKVKNGHCNTSSKQDQYLARWVGKQRANHKAGKLSKEKTDKLLNLGLTLDPHDSIWEKNYNELCKYKNEAGHCNVPRRFPPNQPLANWIRKQITKFRDGMLSRERIIKLEKIGFFLLKY